VVDDPVWIAKILQETVPIRHPAEGDRPDLSNPSSRMRERMDANLRSFGHSSSFVDPNSPPIQVGYQVPVPESPVAAEALKLFLGLELPVALNFTEWGRSRHRMTAVNTYFRQGWSYGVCGELSICWMFRGYQLYASHQIGDVQFRPHPTESMGHIERRMLSGQWIRWGFDGASTPPAGRQWSSHRRRFVLVDGGIQRVGSDDLDLVPEFDERESDAEGEIPPSQEII
jgi:hypothetical protein